MCPDTQHPQHPQHPAASPLVLLVEDHAATREAMTELLRRSFPFFRFEAVETAEQALEMCAVQTPNFIVMDISLPGIDGIEATRRVKQLCPAARVVMHSGNDTAIFRELAAAAGAAAFVSKRSSYADLVPTLSGFLQPTG